MSLFWSLFIIVFTLVNIVACVWLVRWTAKPRPGEVAANETTGNVWDGDLRERNQPLPRWWLGLFYLTIVFGLVYLVLYPGLGNFDGTKNWTQIDRYNQQVQTAQQRYGATFEQYAATDLVALAQDAKAMKLAAGLFSNHCAQCHGSDGHGGKGFPNLADDEWQWGSDPAAIEATIVHGRQAAMPALAVALGEEGTNNVVSYVRSLSGVRSFNGKPVPAEKIAAGGSLYAMQCIACHGPEGKGNTLFGAPDLTNNIWLYGGSAEDIHETLTNGRYGQMPPYKGILEPAKIRLLSAYVMSLSEDGQ